MLRTNTPLMSGYGEVAAQSAIALTLKSRIVSQLFLTYCMCAMFHHAGMRARLRGPRSRAHSYAWVPDSTARLFIGGLGGCLFSAQFHREERWEPFISPDFTLHNRRHCQRCLGERQSKTESATRRDLRFEAKRRKGGLVRTHTHTLRMQKQEKIKSRG